MARALVRASLIANEALASGTFEAVVAVATTEVAVTSSIAVIWALVQDLTILT